MKPYGSVRVVRMWCGMRTDPVLAIYLYFMQDIEDKCLLLTSSTSFVDLTFLEYRMIEKHHMDQNLYTSSLCPKPWVVSDNMTQGDDVAKSSGPTDARWVQPAMVWRQRNYVSTRVMFSW
jgi:hypothetical protein